MTAVLVSAGRMYRFGPQDVIAVSEYFTSGLRASRFWGPNTPTAHRLPQDSERLLVGRVHHMSGYDLS